LIHSCNSKLNTTKFYSRTYNTSDQKVGCING